jgi:putative N6-adenine-specific DNA methylase
VPPGLEQAAEAELRAWLPRTAAGGPEVPAAGGPELKVTAVRGGLEVELPIELGLALPRSLKTCSRVLLRLADFGCRDFPKLFKKSRGLPWTDLILPGEAVEFEASSRSSRLRIKKRIAQAAEDGFRAAMKNAGEAAKDGATEPLRAFVRFADDICEISLDLSGELQHRRGTRALVAQAPLRETVAAGLIYALAQPPSASVAPDAPLSLELFDPMCGSGTFGLEGLALRQPVETRAYAFERLRPVREGRWREASLEANSSAPRFARAIGWDISGRACAAAIGNAGSAGLAERLLIEPRDFFSGPPLAAAEEGCARWLLVNPPYGERLPVGERLAGYYGRLAERAEAVARPARAGFLLPAKVSPASLRWPSSWRSLGKPIALSNGGIPTLFYAFARRA